METTDNEFRLDPEQVRDTYAECEVTGEGDDVIEVDAIVWTARLSKTMLEQKRELITQMLMELPEGFRKSGGGGWSFLQACDDRHGNQWTGLHQTMSMLFALGQGIGMVTSQLPRDMWNYLPGSMPYYVIEA